MAQYKSYDERVQITGETALAIIEGSGNFKNDFLRTLEEFDIESITPDDLIPQQKWLDAFKAFGEKIGESTLFALGLRLPENYRFPIDKPDIRSALGSIDVAYHRAHYLDGEPMLDPDTGEMKEGIGNYKFGIAGVTRAVIDCDTPYPCDFDRGIIFALAKKFKPGDSIMASVFHNRFRPCRKGGSDSCVYIVSW